jgi:hypothetical protein
VATRNGRVTLWGCLNGEPNPGGCRRKAPVAPQARACLLSLAKRSSAPLVSVGMTGSRQAAVACHHASSRDAYRDPEPPWSVAIRPPWPRGPGDRERGPSPAVCQPASHIEPGARPASASLRCPDDGLANDRRGPNARATPSPIRDRMFGAIDHESVIETPAHLENPRRYLPEARICGRARLVRLLLRLRA